MKPKRRRQRKAARPFPTVVGDVLILYTHLSIEVYAVCVVTEDGQQHCGHGANFHATTEAEALTKARSLCAIGKSILIHDMEKRRWKRLC